MKPRAIVYFLVFSYDLRTFTLNHFHSHSLYQIFIATLDSCICSGVQAHPAAAIPGGAGAISSLHLFQFCFSRWRLWKRRRRRWRVHIFCCRIDETGNAGSSTSERPTNELGQSTGCQTNKQRRAARRLLSHLSIWLCGQRASRSCRT